MKIIAFGHKSRVGKDTCAKFAQSQLRSKNIDSVRDSFAYHLKKACHYIYEWAGVRRPEHYEEHHEARNVIIPALGMTVVDLWVIFGTKCCRDKICDLTWVNKTLMREDKPKVLIISDLRFPNEGSRIKELGGVCVEVIRPDQPYREGITVDDRLDGWDGWDYKITNSGSLKDLYTSVETIVKEVI